MNIVFIRHAKTQGNTEKRYIGRTDEGLNAEGVAQAVTLFNSGTLPRPHALITSPYLRSRQTAELLYPGMAYEVNDLFRECDFGIFEGKTHAELEAATAYTAWLQSDCTTDIPGGESVTAFKQRCCQGFLEATRARDKAATLVFVIHGGPIMAILERFSQPKKPFYEYHVQNCEIVTCFFDKMVLEVKQKP